jgi:hypothetical protein
MLRLSLIKFTGLFDIFLYRYILINIENLVLFCYLLNTVNIKYILSQYIVTYKNI